VIPVRRPVTAVRVLAVRPDRAVVKPDDVVTEEPMEIRVAGLAPGSRRVSAGIQPAGAERDAGTAVAVTMRTPGHDFELAAGFLFGEGLIDATEALSVRYCDLPADQAQEFNVVTVGLARAFDVGDRARRFTTTSSCGTCGKASIDQVEVACAPLPVDPDPHRRVSASVLAGLPGRLRAGQRVFGRTGGLHAAALFSVDGELAVLREDVGRHNAVDKVVGHERLAGRLPVEDRILLVSGRVSFEIVQKAAMAGIAVLGAVSAPSSLAVEAADRLGVTVAGFIRDGNCNVYTHADRIATTAG
jgi:FdhD protein